MQSKDKDEKNNVVQLPINNVAPPLVLICSNCQGQLFFIHKSGSVECANCQGIIQAIQIREPE